MSLTFASIRSRFRQFLSYAANPPAARAVWRVFLVLALVDLTLVFVHGGALVAEFMDLIPKVPDALSTFGDASNAEHINYVKWLAVVILMGLVFRTTKAPIFLSMSLIFLLILADDSLRLHERGGEIVRTLWPDMPTFGLQVHQAFEIVIWMLLGCLVLPLAGVGLLWTNSMWYPVAGYVGIGFLAAVFAGIGIDTAQVLYQGLPRGTLLHTINAGAGLIEGLGESLSASLSAAYSFGIWRVYGRDASRTADDVAPL